MKLIIFILKFDRFRVWRSFVDDVAVCRDMLQVDASIDPNQVLTVTIRRAYQRVLLGRVDGRVVVKGRVFIHVLIGLVGFERAGHEHLECVLECGSISF